MANMSPYGPNGPKWPKMTLFDPKMAQNGCFGGQKGVFWPKKGDFGDFRGFWSFWGFWAYGAQRVKMGQNGSF